MKYAPMIGLLGILAIAPASVSCKSSQSLGAQVDDAGIKAKVKTALAKDVRLSTLTNVEVNSTNGIVSLAGQVPNSDDRRLAEQVAGRVSGVVSVNNNLQVESPERR
ncbi:MAG: BON domain-containing protein [Thermoanaerobaculia bacterium]